MRINVRISDLGKEAGLRLFQLMYLREKGMKRETRIVTLLHWLQTIFWKELCGYAADSIERSTDNADECNTLFKISIENRLQSRYIDMLVEIDPIFLKYINVPKEMQPLNCGSFMAGAIESILNASGFVRY